MLFKKYIWQCAFVFCCLVSKSQNCNLVIRGLIQDKDNSETLGFAVVRLLTSEKVYQTNDKGEFVFENLCAGVYQLQVQHVGCKDTIFTIDLKKSRNLTLKLPHSLNNLQEIDVMDKRQEMKKTQTVNQLSEAEIQSTKGQNLGDVLKNVSGVTVINTGATISKPMVQQ